MDDDDGRLRFERLVLPHLDAAYNLARWLTRDEHDAADVVQEASLRALRYAGGLRGDNSRAWLLRIVRHTCWSWLKENRSAQVVSLDDHGGDGGGGGDDDGGRWYELAAPEGNDPLALALAKADRLLINEAIAALPIAYREVIVLRELEDLSYKDIARIADVALGTVMSRLARARALLRDALLAPAQRPTLRPVPRSNRRGAAS